MTTRNTTAKGTFGSFPYLCEADTKFDSDGSYHFKFILDGKAAEDLKDIIRKATDEAFKEGVTNNQKVKPAAKAEAQKAYPFKAEYDDATGNPTGRTVFSFKQKAIIKGKDGESIQMAPKVFDSKGNVIPSGTRIFGGSEGQVCFSMSRGYLNPSTSKFNLTLRPVAVKISRLEGGSGGSMDAFGFAPDEGGLDITKDAIPQGNQEASDQWVDTDEDDFKADF